jgi:hypothetical protein
MVVGVVGATVVIGVIQIIVQPVLVKNKPYSSNPQSINNSNKNKIMAKVEKIKIQRPAQVVKVITGPLSNDLKTKTAAAFEAVVSAIKVKHLGE